MKHGIDLRLKFDDKIFSRSVRNLIQKNSSASFHDVVMESLTSALSKKLDELVISETIYSYQWICYPYSNKGVYCLGDLIKLDRDYDVWYLKLILRSKEEVLSSSNSIRKPANLKWECFKYGPKIQRYFKLKRTKQTTQIKTEIEFLHLKIDKNIFKSVHSIASKKCECHRNNLVPVIESAWDWRLTFSCKICGKSYICTCFKKALSKVPIGDFERPHRIESSKFKTKICHICTKKPSDLFYCSPMYGSDIKVKYGCYIKKLEIELGITERNAENLIRDSLGVPKIGEGWVNETLLYNTIKIMFPGVEVLRESSPDWLQKMRFDIFLPSLALAIEYQGEQHFKPVARFGGEEGFNKTQKRDKEKKKLCEENGVQIIYFNCHEEITEKIILKKLSRYIKDAPEKKRK